MSRLLPAALVLGALTIAGCGSASPVAQFATGAPHVASTPTPVPTATPDVIAIAGQAYLANVGAFNTVFFKVEAAERALPVTAALAAFVPYEREYLAALEKWHTFLTSYAWPASVRDHASVLEAAQQTEITAVGEFVSDPSLDGLGSLNTTYEASTRAAQQLRLALFLPESPTG